VALVNQVSDGSRLVAYARVWEGSPPPITQTAAGATAPAAVVQLLA